MRGPMTANPTLTTASATTPSAFARSGRMRPRSRLADGPKFIDFCPTMPPPKGPRPGPGPAWTRSVSFSCPPASVEPVEPTGGVLSSLISGSPARCPAEERSGAVEERAGESSCSLLRAELGLDDLPVGRRGVEELVVGAATDDDTVLEHEDQVGVADRRHALRDDHHRGVPGHRPQRCAQARV